MPNSLQSSAIASPASRRATNCSLSSITEHSFQGITPSPLRGESVTYVSGTMCYLCLRPFTSKYASILSFPLLGYLPQHTGLSTVCQFHVSPDPVALRVVQGILALVTILGGLSPQEILAPKNTSVSFR